MERAEYWQIIDEAKPDPEDEDAYYERLHEALVQLPEAEILDFERHHSELGQEAYRRDLWSAVSAINGGASDDGFTYFRWWLAVQGEDVFQLALANADSLAEINAATDELENESLGYVALHAWQDATEQPDSYPDWPHAKKKRKPPKLRGRWIQSESAFRRKWPLLWRLLDGPPEMDPEWLNWNDGTIRKMVEQIHEQRNWQDLPVLADALEEAGCSDAFVLDHLREGREHARSCWVTYLLRKQMVSA